MATMVHLLKELCRRRGQISGLNSQTHNKTITILDGPLHQDLLTLTDFLITLCRW